MKPMVSLASLREGDSARVCMLLMQTDIRRRLLEIGLTPGTWVRCELVGPSGDPIAYRIRGALIALRRGDAEGVLVEREAAEKEGAQI